MPASNLGSPERAPLAYDITSVLRQVSVMTVLVFVLLGLLELAEASDTLKAQVVVSVGLVVALALEAFRREYIHLPSRLPGSGAIALPASWWSEAEVQDRTMIAVADYFADQDGVRHIARALLRADSVDTVDPTRQAAVDLVVWSGRARFMAYEFHRALELNLQRSVPFLLLDPDDAIDDGWELPAIEVARPRLLLAVDFGQTARKREMWRDAVEHLAAERFGQEVEVVSREVKPVGLSLAVSGA